MPREHVYDPTPRGVNIETGEDGPERLRRVSVGWSRDRHVQVGLGWVEPPPASVQFDATNTSPTPAAYTTTLPSGWVPTGELDEQGRRWESQWCDMNRHSINRLIRALRKARDEAFGRDE